MEIDFDQVGAGLTFSGGAELVTPNSARAADVPDRWRGVLAGASPAERIRAALSYWDSDFLAMIPRFAQVLRERLLDVRVFWVDSGQRRFFALVYVVPREENGYVCWMGWDPARTEDAPRFWDTFPAPVQNFLRHTHAGFTATEWQTYGIMPPEDFCTLAEFGDWPEGIPGWMDGYVPGHDLTYPGPDYRRIESTRLVVFTKDTGNLFFCTSPDLPVGTVSLVYDGDVSPPKDFGTELDELMTRGLYEI